MTSLHQEVTFAADPPFVYRAIVDMSAFAQFSGAAAVGDATEGVAFSVFGGHVRGRHIELAPNKRVVQAWRESTWPDGAYSIVRFELESDSRGTRLVFDQDGFPEASLEHLSSGWPANYWEKMAKYFAVLAEGRRGL